MIRAPGPIHPKGFLDSDVCLEWDTQILLLAQRDDGAARRAEGSPGPKMDFRLLRSRRLPNGFGWFGAFGPGSF